MSISQDNFSQFSDDFSYIDKPELTSPKTFAEFISDGRWKSAPHLDYINDKLIEISNKQINKLIVNMPPRHGKSEFISCYYLLWYAMKYPNHNVIFVSYNSSIATLFGKKLIGLIERHGENYGIHISKRSKSSKEFTLVINGEFQGENQVNSLGGTYSFTGIGGSLTGKGAQLIIIDDPIKNNTDAFSSNKRNGIWEWYQSTLFTRLEPNSAIIVVMTRWHQDDICGKLFALSDKFLSSIKDETLIHSKYFEEVNGDESLKIKKQTNPNKMIWDKVILPAIAEENDEIGREKGNVLWDERYDINDLLEIKETLGEYWFSAMYQQNPILANGEIFKKEDFRYFTDINGIFYTNMGLINNEKVHNNNCTYYITIDLAMSTNTKADYTVMLVFAVSPENKIFIIEIFREKVSPTKHLDLIKNYFEKYKPNLIGIEKVQYQTALIEEALQHGLPIEELIPRGEKWIRALPIAARMKSGNIYFKSNADWLDEFESELINFPSGDHDDQADAFSYITQIIELSVSQGKLSSAGKKNSISEGYL